MAARSPVAKRPSYLFSTLAETAEEYIKLECARRRNQANIRRRSSLLEQFNVRVSTSRLKERQAQTRHHEFLVRKDNKASVDIIIDRVRELAELNSAARSGSSASLSPMEKARLLAWADDVEKVLYEFEPNENHSQDPIVRMLEKLQFLQDGHVCLAEVAVDARMLLGKWEHDGVFDTSERDEEAENEASDDDEGGDSIASSAEHESEGQFEQRSATWQRDRYQGSQLQHSYAYETVRQRAAANVIKRNVLRWMRSQKSFRDRVEEIQLFGKTTNSLMKELTSTVNMRRSTIVVPSDIFNLVKVKRDGMYAQSIGFMDLMQFSKYVALFPVDQAIRTVEELEMKRFLFKNRCALKLQTIWRKSRKEFQARRMRRLVEELRQQREEQEKEEEKERLALLSKISTPDTSDEKRKSMFPSNKKNRTVSVSTPPSTGGSARTSSTRGDDASLSEFERLTPQSARQRASVSGAKRKESKSRTSTGGGESQERKSRLSKAKFMHARERSRFDDDDDDTKDVENAWQSFLDSTVDLESDTISVTELASDPMPGTGGEQLQPDGIIMSTEVVMPPSFDDDWKNWSDGDESGALRETDDDDEADLKAEEKIARQLRLAASTALPVTPDSETFAEDQRDLYHSRRLRNENNRAQSAQGQHPQSEATRIPTPPLAPPGEPPLQSSYGFQLGDDADRFRVKKTRVGKLSVMVPFAEQETHQNQSQASAEPEGAKRAKLPRAAEKKHLHEMDYGSIARSNLALLQLVDPLVNTEDDDDSLNHEAVRSITQVRNRTSARKRRVDMVKQSIAVRKTTPESITYHVKRPQQQRAVKNVANRGALEPAESLEKPRENTDEAGGRFSYPIQKINIRREVVMRRVSQHNVERGSSPDKPVADNETNSRRESVKRFGTQAEWLRSMGLDSAVRKSPRPPPSRLRTPQRPGENKNPEPLNGDGVILATNTRQRPLKVRKRPKRFLPILERPAGEAKADKEIEDSSLDWDADIGARLPALERDSSRQKRSRETKTKTALSNVESSRGSSAHQTSSRSMGNDDNSAAQGRRPEPSESGSSTDLSIDGSSDSASESDWNEEGACEPNEVQVVDRGAEPRRSRIGDELRESVTLDGGDDRNETEENAVVNEPGKPGYRSVSRPHVRFVVGNKALKQQPSPDQSLRTKKSLTKRRVREAGGDDELDQDDDELDQDDDELDQDDDELDQDDDELDQDDDEDGRLDVLSADQDSSSIGISYKAGSAIQRSSLTTDKAKAYARGALRSHDPTSRGGLSTDDGETREPEATPNSIATKKQQQKSSVRHAAFQRLMMQYLGLLQCNPPSVAMLPVGSGS